MAKQRSNSFNTYINIITSIGVMAINLIISFWLSPYIIQTIGVEANGFVSLANNFVTYANLVVTALNAMAARFITIAYIQKDYKKANMYYNSVFWGNLIIVALLLLPAVYLIARLENFIDIPSDILLDVKTLFSLVFLAFFVRTGAPNYDCGTYITNRMDLSYIPNMATSILRCIILVSMFALWNPHVWYVSFTSTVISFITLGIAGYFTHKLTPELRVNLRHPICSKCAIWELVGSGIWSAIAGGGAMLLNGLDLLICNLYVGATAMGILSLSKTLPSVLGQLSDAITDAFVPEMTINYATGSKDILLSNIKRSIKISSVILTIPAGGIAVMSDAFYSLWVPSQDARLLQILTTLAIMSYLITSGNNILLRVFAIVNRTRLSAVAMIISGVLSLFVTWAIIVSTEYDIYAVAGVSTVITICKNVFFVTPVTSILLGYKWHQFLPQIGVTVISSVTTILVGVVIRWFVSVDSWITFFFASAIIAMVGLFLNMVIVLNREERRYLINKFLGKFIKQQ